MVDGDMLGENKFKKKRRKKKKKRKKNRNPKKPKRPSHLQMEDIINEYCDEIEEDLRKELRRALDNYMDLDKIDVDKLGRANQLFVNESTRDMAVVRDTVCFWVGIVVTLATVVVIICLVCIVPKYMASNDLNEARKTLDESHKNEEMGHERNMILIRSDANKKQANANVALNDMHEREKIQNTNPTLDDSGENELTNATFALKELDEKQDLQDTNLKLNDSRANEELQENNDTITKIIYKPNRDI